MAWRYVHRTHTRPIANLHVYLVQSNDAASGVGGLNVGTTQMFTRHIKRGAPLLLST
jgi:hypothetical protein